MVNKHPLVSGCRANIDLSVLQHVAGQIKHSCSWEEPVTWLITLVNKPPSVRHQQTTHGEKQQLCSISVKKLLQ